MPRYISRVICVLGLACTPLWAQAANDGIAASQAPIQLPTFDSSIGAYAAAPDGSIYAAAGSCSSCASSDLIRIAADGTTSTIYTLTSGGSIGPVRVDSGGNIYGYIYPPTYGDPVQFFLIAPDGQVKLLTTIAVTAGGGDINVVQAADGNYYGITFDTGPIATLFKVTGEGTVSTVGTFVPGDFSATSLVAGSDGKLYGIYLDDSGLAFSLSTDATYTDIYSDGAPLTSITAGNDGALYLTDVTAPAVGAVSRVLRLTGDGSATVLHEFPADVWNHYVWGAWTCGPSPGSGCHWVPGHWTVSLLDFNADGFNPISLRQGADGDLYGITVEQGLNGYGTVFRMAPDGTGFTTLHCLTRNFNIMPTPQLLFGAGGNPVLINTTYNQLTTIDLSAALGTAISFSLPQVYLGQATVLNWTSSGAQSCTLISDIPGFTTQPVATSGSQYVRIYTRGNRSPAQYTAGLQCTAADGSFSSASASVTIR